MSLSQLRRAHRNAVYLPGPGDFDPPEPKGELEPCAACLTSDTSTCTECDGKGWLLNGVPMTPREYERLVERAREEAYS